MVLRLNSTQKYWVFLATTVLAGLYLYEGTGQWVAKIVEFKLEFAPIMNVKNLLAIMLAYIFYKIFIAGRN